MKRPETRLAAGKEYHRKTTGPHQMWATDASYFRVVGWGYYYLVTVMDDYSRFILSHMLQRDMTADSFIEVVQEAVDRTRMDQVPVTDCTRLLSDNGPGYCLKSIQRLPGDGGHQAHPGNPFPPSDQWEAGALPPDAEAGRQPGVLQVARRPGGGYRGLRQLLQLPALSQSPGQRDTIRRAQGKAARNSTTQEGGAGSNDRKATTLQQGYQGAHQTSIQHLISRLPQCPTFAGCQQ